MLELMWHPVELIQAMLSGITGIVALLWWLITIIAGWKVFEKAGEEGWKSIIPFYNLFILCKITFGSGWLFLIYAIPAVGTIFYVITTWRLGTVFRKSTLFKLGLIFLNPLFMVLLGLGDSRYYGPYDNVI